jgi:hypothetical protein
MSQLFLGKFDNLGTVGSQYFAFFNASTTAGSAQITSIDASIDKLQVGQTVEEFSGAFTTPPTIVSIDSATQITVNANATSNTTSNFFAASTPEGTYFFSGSMLDPNSTIFNTDITGSNDTDFNLAEGQYAILSPVKTGFNGAGSNVYGVYHVYNVSSVIYRNPDLTGMEMFVTFSETGSEATLNEYLNPGVTSYALVKRSEKEQLTPSIDNSITNLDTLPDDIGIASFNIAVTDFFDNYTLTDVYYTGSEVLINTQQMNFSGSGVEVTISGSDGILVDIKNDTLTSFYTGSEVLTEPTNKINFTGSGVEVESSGSDGILVTIDGGGSGGTYTNTDPTPINFPSDDDPNIPSGTTFTNKTFPEMMDLMLYPELDPTLTNPSNTFSISPSGLREIGETIATITLSATFNKGSISPAYGTTGFRSGDPNNYVYTGTDASDNASTALTDTETISSYTVLLGSNSWTGAVAYNEGPQPLTSKGNNFSSPLSAGTTPAITRTITGVFPVFATTSAIGTLTKQSLQSMTTYIQVSMVAETGGNKQTIDIPDAWATITGAQQFNTFSGTWDSINLSQFTITSVTNTIQGNPINYKRYTHNSNTIGARQLRFTV